MNNSVGIIGGADGPTAIFVTRPLGESALWAFGALLAALAVLVLLSRLTKKTTPFAVIGAALVVLADQYVKLLLGSMELGETAALLPGLLRLESVRNYGRCSSSSRARGFACWRIWR